MGFETGFICTYLLICYYIYESSAIITNGNGFEGGNREYNRTAAHLISITESTPTRYAQPKVDSSRTSQLGEEQSIERHSLHTSSSHHYPEYQLSYGGSYDFGGSFGGGHEGSFGGGHGGSFGGGHGDENSLESGGGSGEGFGNHHYIPMHHGNGNGNGKHGNPKAAALKGLLVPLAGVALLGAAAALVSNPILLQLGVITGKKRRRRSTDEDFPNLSPEEAQAVKQKLNEIALLEKFMAQIPKEQAVSQEKQLLANYLSCSGSMNANSTLCLERLTCELHHPESDATQLEKHVMGIVTSEILTNEYVPEGVKKRVRSAARIGNTFGNCTQFPCNELETN